jgi:O-antigen ligase
MSFPYGMPIFFPVVCFSFFCLFIKNLNERYLVLKLNTGMILFYVCILMYFIGIIASKGLVFRINHRDLKNIASLLMLSLMLGALVWQRYQRFIVIYHRLIVPLMSLVALFALYNFYCLIWGANFILVSKERAQYAFGTSLSGSYNIFALGMLAGIFAGACAFSRSRSILFRVICVICILLCSTTILFAGSRRGWILLSVLVFGLVVKLVIVFFRASLSGGASVFFFLRKNLRVVVVIVALISMVFVFLVERGFDFVKPVEIHRLVYRLSTLGEREGGFRGAFSKRTELWAYSGELIDEYSFYGLCFGGGFEYLKLIGRKTGDGERGEGDPHNFIISAMLYSGFIGTAAMIALIALTLFKLITKREKYGNEFLLLYIATLIFTITGAPSFFSIRLLPLVTLTVVSVGD